MHNVSVQDAWLEAEEADTDVEFDGDAMNPHIAYLDENNIRHDVWFLDGVTALNQMRAAQSLGIDTFALWRLGSEDRSLWAIWDKPGEAAATTKLNVVPPGQDVDIEGKGEILHIQARPASGERQIVVDPETNLVSDEMFKTLPSPYTVDMYGSSPNKIAITFDDGPDPEWTPKILDVLKEKGAKATFFVIGVEAEKIPEHHQANLCRRSRDRQPHLHPSRHQQRLQALFRGRAEPDRAPVRGQARRQARTVPAAILD